jgi:small subunit ribosomal protein S3e
MKGWDPEGQLGPRKPLPDSVQILEPPLDKIVVEPTSEQREPAAVVPPPAPAAEESTYQQPQEGFTAQYDQPAEEAF